MVIQAFPFNPLEENTYVVSDATQEALIIDCGAMHDSEQESLSTYIQQHGLRPVAHILTHAHFDHVLGAPYLYQTYGLAPRLHPADAELYNHIDQQMIMLMGRPLGLQLPPLGLPLDCNDVSHETQQDSHDADLGASPDGSIASVRVGSHAFRIIPTPGHTQGGVCLYCAEAKVLFTGDSLFRQSIGRTDLPGGNYQSLIRSLAHLFSWLPDDVTIYPGHGPATTAGFERRYNPFLGKSDTR